MERLVVRTFEEEEYHTFFKGYIPDPMMDAPPFFYNHEQISRSYRYNHGGFRPDYAHYGAFLNQEPVGSLQLKRIDFYDFLRLKLQFLSLDRSRK